MKIIPIIFFLYSPIILCAQALDPENIYRERELQKKQKNSDTITVPFPLDPQSGQIVFTDVVKVDSASDETLYSRAKLHIANSFKSAKAVTQSDDPLSKTILIKGNFPGLIEYKEGLSKYGYIEFKMTIMCKDNRYKYIIEDFGYYTDRYNDGPFPLTSKSFKMTWNTSISQKRWNDIRTNAYLYILTLIAGLKENMASTDNESW